MKSILLVSGALAGAAALPTAQECGQSCKDSPKAATASHAAAETIVDTAVAAGSFDTLVAALKAAGLVEALQGEGPFTVFAPSDDAFAKLPEDALASLLDPKNRAKLQRVLKYHVVPGNVLAEDVVELDFADTLAAQRVDVAVSKKGVVSIDGARVTATDIECSNGTIHVVDTVLMPSQDDLVATAVGAGSFGTLAAALEAGGLVEALQGEGPFTVFAPTDAAFAKLPEGTVASLLEPENRDRLVAILKYHVVPGRVYSDQVVEIESAETLQGGSVRVRAGEDGVRIDDANVTAVDVEATNGVIHVLDTVLLPE